MVMIPCRDKKWTHVVNWECILEQIKGSVVCMPSPSACPALGYKGEPGAVPGGRSPVLYRCSDDSTNHSCQALIRSETESKHSASCGDANALTWQPRNTPN